MEKINVAELLRNCPKGMELNCTMYENCTFNGLKDFDSYAKEPPYPIKVQTPDGRIDLNKYGCFSHNEYSKCIIFPKGKTTWEGFQRPFKDGDIVAGENCACDYITIFRKFIDDTSFSHYACLTGFGKFKIDDISDNANLRFATKEEKAKLFQAIKDNGYVWNEETKSLEKLPKIKVSDRVKKKSIDDVDAVEIAKIIQSMHTFTNKFDITTLKPLESKVLVRDCVDGMWKPTFWGKDLEDYNYRYLTSSGYYKQCIPYEGNEHLLGTTNDCDEYFKNW